MTGDAKKGWALILGGSSGLGLATARKLARHGFDLVIVHRDRRADIKEIQSHFQKISSNGIQLKSYNLDVANAEKRSTAIGEIKSLLEEGQTLKVLVHSIAKGSLKPMFFEERSPSEERNPLGDQNHSKERKPAERRNLSRNSNWQGERSPVLDHRDFELTLNAMALSLYDWTKELANEGLFDADARIISFTSEGSSKAWPGYAAVSAAKATLEALTRNIALEFASIGIKANCIQAGTTDTKAFRMIPDHGSIKENALQRNPNSRLTLPEDIANAVYLLTTEEARWITGTVIKVDGGESLR
ncbi:SDR family oxidoreductase [Pricia sp. S334]|uniref:SDR family oxidoreductase n=1 Tax=Pricia mediterranea TaxID=3076079 RepID=A0ABU3LBA8_9FLAO|nr:SDR family oxidoreductase [Pricia sp. S334]MDT7830566.1 SDR family oxidoreductase [Pricia sp. S334]